jgi:vacuolar iron transporter family protein
VSNYQGTKTQREQIDEARASEERHIELIPEGEREEIRQIYAAKGFEGDDLERAVEIITSDRQRWIEVMLREELGFSHGVEEPVRAGLSTFAAFVVVGAIPLLAFVYDQLQPGVIGDPFVWSAVLTGMAFFGVGALNGRFVEQPWWLSGAETLGVGGVAATMAYVIGSLLSGLV